jgi:hypothetical protein
MVMRLIAAFALAGAISVPQAVVAEPIPQDDWCRAFGALMATYWLENPSREDVAEAYEGVSSEEVVACQSSLNLSEAYGIESASGLDVDGVVPSGGWLISSEGEELVGLPGSMWRLPEPAASMTPNPSSTAQPTPSPTPKPRFKEKKWSITKRGQGSDDFFVRVPGSSSVRLTYTVTNTHGYGCSSYVYVWADGYWQSQENLGLNFDARGSKTRRQRSWELSYTRANKRERIKVLSNCPWVLKLNGTKRVRAN